MIWRIMQLALCVIIWSVLISVALFKLNPVVGSTSTPVGTQSIKSKSVQASKNKRKSDIECDNESRSESIINEKLTNMIWDASDYSKPRYTKNQLMNLLKDLSATGEVAIQQVIKLIDLELEIINNLLHRTNAHIIQQIVAKRDVLLEISLPTAIEVYDMILSIAAAENGERESIARAPFLRNMMERLEQYHLIIKTMQNTSKTVRQ